MLVQEEQAALLGVQALHNRLELAALKLSRMQILREHLELELEQSIVGLKSVAHLDWGEKVKLRKSWVYI